MKYDDTLGLKIALEQAKKSASEGGVPIGSCIIADINGELTVVGASHNQRIQKGSAILHGETAALEQAGRLKANVYRKSTIVRSPSEIPLEYSFRLTNKPLGYPHTCSTPLSAPATCAPARFCSTTSRA